ncbi:type II toxin-antitoxin system PemK/MazF family toxin [Nocardiopsis sp. CC223A]|uniref:type II toxin-antitoxin system PemK/MazF family toxin n=1 Tax=Nocardiopsis sp. CC223A TaxID=3044051 RepID=UPI00278BC46D|nr:type II toxin-antitoxin system PemK/MazF family toxin [Nocardiopsis sp. CC223A]
MVRRGEIHMADPGDPIGHGQAFRRPVLIVGGRPWLDSNPPVFTVVPLTRTCRESPTRVEIGPGSSGLKEIGHAECGDLRAISPLRLERSFGTVEDTVLFRVELVLRRLLVL